MVVLKMVQQVFYLFFFLSFSPECQQCNKKFETPSKLLRHQSVHRKQRNHDSEATLEISTVTSILGD
jgi:hypothetical protein